MEEEKIGEISRACADHEALWKWVKDHLGMEVPKKAFCAHHHAPFDYLKHVYFEPNSDVVVWGPRKGGKTRLAAVATLLDLLHKPGIAVRILGGSIEQSMRVWEHLAPELEKLPRDLFRKLWARSVVMKSGSSVAALTQSTRTVRGQQVQKMRCDEVDEFTMEVWRAAGGTTISKPIVGAPTTEVTVAGKPIIVRGTVEALSTYHHTDKVMREVLARAEENGTPVFKWCILDVMARCEEGRDCETCPLLKECGRRAKTEASGYMSVEDVIGYKNRMSPEQWLSEMLCLKPSTEGRVFPAFDFDQHVRATDFAGELTIGVDFGFANPFVALWAGKDENGVVHVVDEWSKNSTLLEEHVRTLKARRPAKRVHCDPAGRAKNGQTGVSDIGYLKSQGFDVRSCKSGIVEGIERIRRLLAGPDKKPRMFVHPRCRTLIAALTSYRYPERNRSETPEKDGVNDHPIDALRYWLANWETGGEVQSKRY